MGMPGYSPVSPYDSARSEGYPQPVGNLPASVVPYAPEARGFPPTPQPPAPQRGALANAWDKLTAYMAQGGVGDTRGTVGLTAAPTMPPMTHSFRPDYNELLANPPM